MITADDKLIIAAGTGPLKPGQRGAIAALLEPPAGEHPWPSELPAGRAGIVGGGPRRLAVALVEATVVAEVEADQPYEHRRPGPGAPARRPRHPVRASRNAALFAIAADLPAAVLADSLGTNITTAVAWPTTPAATGTPFVSERVELSRQSGR